LEYNVVRNRQLSLAVKTNPVLVLEYVIRC